MTTHTKTLVERLEALPEAEQERVAARLLQRLDEEERRAESPADEGAEEEDEEDPYGFQVLIDAKVTSLRPDFSRTYERDLYGRTHDLD